MRTTTLIAFLAGLAVAAGAGVLLRDDGVLQSLMSSQAVHDTPQATKAEASSDTPIASIPQRAAPTQPRYAAAPEEPNPIYRCRIGSRTTYSNEPCPGARVVDETSAVSGFDSRPSERLARLVAEGRNTAVADATPVVVPRRARTSSIDECALLARQIRDIDADTLQPHTPRALDELRQTRQDIRTRMALLHC